MVITFNAPFAINGGILGIRCDLTSQKSTGTLLAFQSRTVQVQVRQEILKVVSVPFAQSLTPQDDLSKLDVDLASTFGKPISATLRLSLSTNKVQMAFQTSLFTFRWQMPRLAKPLIVFLKKESVCGTIYSQNLWHLYGLRLETIVVIGLMSWPGSLSSAFQVTTKMSYSRWCMGLLARVACLVAIIACLALSRWVPTSMARKGLLVRTMLAKARRKFSLLTRYFGSRIESNHGSSIMVSCLIKEKGCRRRFETSLQNEE